MDKLPISRLIFDEANFNIQFNNEELIQALNNACLKYGFDSYQAFIEKFNNGDVQ